MLLRYGMMIASEAHGRGSRGNASSESQPSPGCGNLLCFSNLRRCVDDYDLLKQLYRGKASLLYRATCRHSNQPVALKLYRKHKLSTLNWYQVCGRCNGRCLISRRSCSPGTWR